MPKRPSTRSVRIKGLVRVAETVRRELSGPVSPDRKAHLRATIANSIGAVDRIVEEHGVSIDHLPTPSQRAYRFLAGLDLDAIPTQSTDESRKAARGEVRLVGVKSYLDGILVRLADPLSPEDAAELHDAIRSASTNIEEYLEANGLEAQDLTPQSRSIRCCERRLKSAAPGG